MIYMVVDVCVSDRCSVGSSRTPGTTMNIVNRWELQPSFCFASSAIDDAQHIADSSDIFCSANQLKMASVRRLKAEMNTKLNFGWHLPTAAPHVLVGFRWIECIVSTSINRHG